MLNFPQTMLSLIPVSNTVSAFMSYYTTLLQHSGTGMSTNIPHFSALFPAPPPPPPAPRHMSFYMSFVGVFPPTCCPHGGKSYCPLCIEHPSPNPTHTPTHTAGNKPWMAMSMWHLEQMGSMLILIDALVSMWHLEQMVSVLILIDALVSMWQGNDTLRQFWWFPWKRCHTLCLTPTWTT